MLCLVVWREEEEKEKEEEGEQVYKCMFLSIIHRDCDHTQVCYSI